MGLSGYQRGDRVLYYLSNEIEPWDFVTLSIRPEFPAGPMPCWVAPLTSW